MKSNSNEYYKNKTSSFVKKWEAKRKNKPLYAFKEALIFAFPFSFIFIFFEIGITEKFLYKFPLFFFINLIIYFLFTYFVSYKFNEKNYLKYKKEGF